MNRASREVPLDGRPGGNDGRDGQDYETISVSETEVQQAGYAAFTPGVKRVRDPIVLGV